MKTAKAVKVKIPQSILVCANRVINLAQAQAQANGRLAEFF